MSEDDKECTPPEGPSSLLEDEVIRGVFTALLATACTLEQLELGYMREVAVRAGVVLHACKTLGVPASTFYRRTERGESIPPGVASILAKLPPDLKLEELSKAYCLYVLRAKSNEVKAAATALNIGRTTLNTYLRNWGIPFNRPKARKTRT